MTTTPTTQEDDVKRNDIACLRVNYDVEGWRKLTDGFKINNVAAGSILAIHSLCNEVEQLRAHMDAQAVRLDAAELDAERYRHLRDMPFTAPSLGVEVTYWDGDGSGEAMRGGELDVNIDLVLAAIASEAGK